ncbi:DUF4344 domain-containing metallopeptidase [Streptomyces subrutilus]|uniref:DUF4344 domain-containing metallopeptidase n=1 Tax=Streptomyces subrutilus TaxID=36818 RepID=UPI003441784A
MSRPQAPSAPAAAPRAAARAAPLVAALIATLVATTAAALTACTAPGPRPATGFTLRYERPAAADRASHRFLRDRRTAEHALAELDALLSLPYEVAVVARSCAGEGSGYDPRTRRIELCYDDLPEERDPFVRAGHPDPDGALADVVGETVHHEAGHALLDALGLPAEGDRAEEDSADDFARLMLLRAGPRGEAALLTAARAHDLTAAEDGAPDPADEHAPPAARAEAHRCAVLAAAPDRHPDLATPSRAPCTAAWTHTRTTWTQALTPLLHRWATPEPRLRPGPAAAAVLVEGRPAGRLLRSLKAVGDPTTCGPARAVQSSGAAL